LLALLVLLVGLLVYIYMFLPTRGQGSASSRVIDPQVALVVAQFGKNMQYVPLQAPARDVRSAVDANYGAYVTPELISVWKADTKHVPGRLTSSPWPDRIEIQSVDPQADGSYIVRGVVVEVTSSEVESGGIAGTYPVTLRLARHERQWLIMQFEAGAYSVIPHEVILRGTYTCLPHLDTSGPQTMECALGIKSDESDRYYALDTSLVQSGGMMMLPTGTHMSVSGILTPVEMLSSIQKYDIAGIIRVTNILEPIR
jgi:hypothetical protein